MTDIILEETIAENHMAAVRVKAPSQVAIL